MSLQATLKRNIIEDHIEDELVSIADKVFGKKFSDCSDKEVYYCTLYLTKSLAEATTEIAGPKKVYYISMEFLIGKLLSNNLINLGVYDKVKNVLAKYGKDISAIEECEPEPSLGNGGLGRLAACFPRSGLAYRLRQGEAQG